MKKYAFAILSLVFISTMFISCNKQNKEYLLGEWVLMTKPVEELDYHWYFKEDKVYITATDGNDNDIPTGELDTCNYGPYVLKNGVLSIALTEKYCRQMVYAGDWDVQVISEAFLTIRRETESGSQWYEFEKAQSK
jgi:hypothetical protein